MWYNCSIENAPRCYEQPGRESALEVLTVTIVPQLAQPPTTTFLHVFYYGGGVAYPILQEPLRLSPAKETGNIPDYVQESFDAIFGLRPIQTFVSLYSHVYITQAVDGEIKDAYKIGWTHADVYKRTSGIAYEAKGPVRRLWSIKVASTYARELEVALHYHFRRKCIGGRREWFWLNEKDIEDIKTIPGGSLIYRKNGKVAP